MSSDATPATRHRNARYTPVAADGPLPWRMVAAVPTIMRNPLRFLAACVARHGDVVAFPLGERAAVLVDDPRAVRHVLQENHRNYTKATVQYTSLALVTGQGLLTSDGEVWRRHRRIVQPAFARASLGNVAAASLQAAAAVRDEWDAAPDGVVDVDDVLMRATLDVVGRTLFGADLVAGGEADGHRLVAAVHEALAVVVRRAQQPWTAPPGLPTPLARRLARATRVLDEVSEALVAKRAERPEGEDLLSGLLAAGLTAREVRDELVTLVIAGHETVATSLSWTLRLLADDQLTQARLHSELDEVLAGREPGWADVAELPVTRAVVDEALRLYPPAWVITRRSVAADEVAGVRIPEGTLVILSPWLQHRRPEVWPEPERFDIDRWLGASTRRPPLGYLPFGAGPRLCIGREFALVESVLMVASLLRDRMLYAPSPRPGVVASVTLRPRGGMPLAWRPRRPAPTSAGDDPVEAPSAVLPTG